MKAKGIHSHKLFRLGKGKARRDERNLRLAAILRAPAALPAEWDYDLEHTGIPTPMFGNDFFGDCVIAGRAHQTLRFEDWEQHKVLPITDKIVLNEYFRQTGGHDDGLVVLDSLNLWRRKGWTIRKHPYRIQAFAEINRANHDEVRAAIYGHIGAGIGVGLPLTAQDQTQMGQPWDYVGGSGSEPWSWGGHYVYLSGYNLIGPVCVTWGRKQQITWKFFDQYCDEAYTIFDRVNRFKKTVDVAAVKEFLETLAAA